MEKKLKIGLLTSMPDESYAALIIKGVAAACNDRGISLNIYSGTPLASPNLNDRGQNAIYNFADEPSLDGLIISTASMHWYLDIDEKHDLFEKCKSFPTVSIGLPIPGINSIEIDNLTGMKAVVSHLVKDHHFEKIAYVGGPVNYLSARNRLNAYKEVLKENGLEYSSDLYLQGNYSRSSGSAAARELIVNRKKRVEAIVCANDDMASGVIKELQSMGYHVPRDVAVTGFDDIESFRYIYPSYTTVMHPIYELGYKSTEILIDKIKGGELPKITLLQPTLIIRESCGCTHDPLSENERIVEKGDLNNIPGITSIDDLKTYLIQLIMDAFPSGKNYGKQLSVIIDELLTNLFYDLGSFNTHSRFIEYISENLSDENAAIFREAVNASFNVFTFMLRGKPEISSVEKYFIHALSILSEHYRSNKQNAYWKMRQLNDVISSKQTLESLLNEIGNDFSEIIGLKSFFISFYYDESKRILGYAQAPTGLSKLVLAYNNGLVGIDDRDRIFETKKLLPEKLMRPDGTIFFILSLSYMDEHYGFITFEFDEGRLKYYEFIQEQLSLALNTMNLVNRIKKEKDYAISLQKKAERQLEEFLTALGSAIESKDNYTGGHVERVGSYSRDIAEKLGLSDQEVREIYLGAIVHDVGKIGIRDSILNKPGRLTPEETKHMQQHPGIGKDILSKIADIDTAIKIAYSHQERYDGCGYPEGLKGEEIPLCARIAAIADYWDAITSDRPYRGAMPLMTAIELMYSESGKAFDPELLNIFMNSEDTLYLNYIPADKLKEHA